ncbi:MAG TPA: cyclic nucleotide-binding domain-containing protein [Alphaproteobacteria bacterium]|nr:cyclic nucleotide-binding domain-containing protein [Alphaproteobacteria bacterium]
MSVARRFCDERAFLPRQEVFAEGAVADGMYLVQAGTVEIWRGAGADRLRLAVLEAGQIFGEMALLNDAPRMAAAIAGPRGATLTWVPRALFVHKMAQSDPLVVSVARLIIENLKCGNDRLAAVSRELADTKARLAAAEAERDSLKAAVLEGLQRRAARLAG